MRFQCNATIAHRMKPSLTQPKSCTTISLFKSADGMELMMHLLPSKRNTGMKYKIRRNIVRVYSNFILEGKLTVSLISPPLDVIISSAEHDVLMKFLEAIKIGHKCSNIKELDIKLHPKSCSKKDLLLVERPKQKLKILSPSNYPHSTRFPQSLVKLIINNCKLSRLDSRIIQLKQLKVLDISQNKLTLLPCLDNLVSLKEIILSHNEFAYFPSALISKQLLYSLRLLDISHNRMYYVDPGICDLKSIVNLDLSNNVLACLPFNLHKLSTLQHLNVSDNQLISIPLTILQLKLITLNLSQNNFTNKETRKPLSNPTSRILSLQEICGKLILLSKSKINDDHIPLHLKDFLKAHVPCACGSVCFYYKDIMYLETNMMKVAMTTTVSQYDMLQYDPVTLHCYRCSPQCKTKYIF